MPLSIISSDFFLPPGSVKLGRLVKYIESPEHSCCDPPYPQAPEGKLLIRSQYVGVSQSENRAGFTAKLTSLMSSGFSKRADTKVRIETNLVKTYTLHNSEAWFMEATNFDSTRKWIEGAIGGNGIYFITGFHTVTDARIIDESTQGHQIAGKAAFPVGLSLAAVGAIAPLGGILDPAMSGHQKVLNGVKIQFIAPGEQICALQYLKISYRWLHSKNIDNLKPPKAPRWIAKESWRSASVDEAKEEPDMLEVETEEFEQLGGDWEREEGEEGEILLMQSVEESEEF